MSHDLETAEQVIDMFCLADSDHGILVVKAWGGLKVSTIESPLHVINGRNKHHSGGKKLAT